MEHKHKLNPSKKLCQEIQEVTNVVISMEAREVAKDLMYAMQHIFEYWDKPEKQLARVLADSVGKRAVLKGMTREGWLHIQHRK